MQRQYGHDTFGIIVEGISTTTRQISLTRLKEVHDYSTNDPRYFSVSLILIHASGRQTIDG